MYDEAKIRLGLFFGVFVLVALLEMLRPRRALTTSKGSRWFANLAMVALNPLSVRLLFPDGTGGSAPPKTRRNEGTTA
jgi:hypothetical protein